MAGSDWIRAKRRTAQQLGRFSRRGVDAGELLVVVECLRRLQGAGHSSGPCGYLLSDPAAVGAVGVIYL